MAGGPQGAAGPGEGLHPARATRSTPSAAGCRWCEIDKDYVFQGPDGPVDAARPVRRPAPADRRHFMFDPSWEEGCPSCTAGADEMSDGLLEHLHVRDTTLVVCRPARRSRSSSATRPSGAGRSRGTPRTAATSTTTSTSRSTSRLRPSSTTTGPRPSTRRQARATTSRATSRSSSRARATSCATATRCSTPTRPSPAAPSDRRLVLLPRPHGARPPGGVGGAEGSRRASVRRVAGVRHLSR